MSNPQPSSEKINARMTEMINHYASTTSFNSTLTKLFESSENADKFWSSLEHDFRVLQTKSHDMEDHEMSLSQKSFLIIRTETSEPIPAANIYFEQILCLGSDGSPGNIYASLYRVSIVSEARSVQQAQPKAQLFTDSQGSEQEVISSSKLPIQTMLGDSSKDNDNDTGDLPHDTAELEANKSEIHPGLLPRPLKQERAHDDRIKESKKKTISKDVMETLCQKYEQAKSDLKAARPKTFAHTQAAKYLRDTAENCINHLKSREPREAALEMTLLDDFQNWLEQATVIAEQGSGGKKRPFEQDSEDSHHKDKNTADSERHIGPYRVTLPFQDQGRGAVPEAKRHSRRRNHRNRVDPVAASRVLRHQIDYRHHRGEEARTGRQDQSRSLSSHSRHRQIRRPSEQRTADNYRPSYR